MKTEIMHVYEGDGRKAAELDVTHKTGAEIATIIENPGDGRQALRY